VSSFVGRLKVCTHSKLQNVADFWMFL
jgi:hypothetical protein